MADSDPAVFYPPNLLYLIFKPERGLVIIAILHVFLAVLAMIRFSKYLGIERYVSYYAAFSFAFSAPIVGRFHEGNIQAAIAICYIPLLFLLGAKLQDSFSMKLLVYLACVLTLQLLCGHPQFFWISCLGLALFAVGRRTEPPILTSIRSGVIDLLRLAAAVLLAVGLSAVQVLPSLEWLREGNRLVPSIEFSSLGSMSWTSWVSLLIPGGVIIPGSPRPVFASDFNVYAGVIVLLGGICGLTLVRDRNVRGLILVSVVSSLVALGDRTPYFDLLYHNLPGLSLFRVHSRTAILVVFSLTMATGLFLSSSPSPRWSVPLLVGSAMGGLSIVIGIQFGLLQAIGGKGSWLVARSGMILVGMMLLCAWHNRQRLEKGWYSYLIALLLFFSSYDLGSSIWDMKTLWSLSPDFGGEMIVRDTLQEFGLHAEDGVPPRVFFLPKPQVIRPNSGMLYKYSTVVGTGSFMLDRVWVYLHSSLGLEAPRLLKITPSTEIFRLGPFPYRSMNLVLAFDPLTKRVAVNSNPDPRVYLSHKIAVVPSWREAVRLMRAGHNYHDTALLEAPLAGHPIEGGGTGVSSARIISFQPEEIVLETESSETALLVLAEPWYPGWRARVNGRDIACVPANGWMRAVPVPAGKHRVVVYLRSRYLMLGALVSGLSLLLAGLILRKVRSPDATRFARPPRVAWSKLGESK